MIKQDDEETVRRRCCCVRLVTFSLSLSLSPSIQMVKSSVRSIPERAQHTTAIAFADSSCGMLFTCSLSHLSFIFFLSFLVRSLLSPSLRSIHPTRRDLGDVGTSVGRTLSRRADANANHSRRQSRPHLSLCRFQTDCPLFVVTVSMCRVLG